MVQLDASAHLWLPDVLDTQTGEIIKTKLHLHLAIDDAASVILGGLFALEETTEAYFKLVHEIVTNPAYGVPSIFYTDRRSTFVFNGSKSKGREAKLMFNLPEPAIA